MFLLVPRGCRAMALAGLLWSTASIAGAQSGAPTDADEELQDAIGFGSEQEPGESPSSADELGFGASESEPGPDGDDAAQGYEQSAGATEAAAEPSPLSLGGRYRLRGALWLERLETTPLSQARSLLGLWLRYSTDFELFGEPAQLRALISGRGEYDAAYLVDRDRYDAPTLETYEWLLMAEESYLSLAVGGFDVAAGLLQTTLGQGEVLGLIALNPRDYRDPGLTDPSELSLAVLAARSGVTIERHRLEVYVVFESFFGLRPPPIATLSPLRALILAEPLAADMLVEREWRYRDRPGRFAGGNFQTLGRYAFSGDGFDLEFFGGSLLDRLGVARLPEAPAFDRDELTVDNYHPRYSMFAHAGGLTAGPWLLRWELSVELDRPLGVRLTDSAFLQLAAERHTQLGALLAFTYFGASGTNIGFEVQQSAVLGNPERSPQSGRELLFPVEATQLALRVRQTLLRERLELSLIGLLIGVVDFNSAMVSAEASYALVDSLRVALGGVAYLPGDELGPFYGLDTHERVYLELRWDFTLL